MDQLHGPRSKATLSCPDRLSSLVLKDPLAHARYKAQILHCFSPSNGQTEVVNKSLGNLLRTLVGKNDESWDLRLSITEFAYNSSVNGTDKSLRKCVILA